MLVFSEHGPIETVKPVFHLKYCGGVNLPF